MDTLIQDSNRLFADNFAICDFILGNANDSILLRDAYYSESGKTCVWIFQGLTPGDFNKQGKLSGCDQFNIQYNIFWNNFIFLRIFLPCHIQYSLSNMSGKFCPQTGKTPDSTSKEAQRKKIEPRSIRISITGTSLSLDIRRDLI